MVITAAAVITFAVAGAFAQTEVTPVQQVITLMENLHAEIQSEGANEAKTYDEYACFCKDTTLSKSTAVKDGKDNIDSLSASMEEKTAEKKKKEGEVVDRKKKGEELAADLQKANAQFAKDKAEYEATSADLDKAISSLQSAIKALQDSQPQVAAAPVTAAVESEAGTSFLELRSSISQTLKLADAMGLSPKGQKRNALSAFLQVDPDDPDYKFHSQGIVDILNELLQDFSSNKKEVDEEFAKTKSTADATIGDLTTQIGENDAAIQTLEGEIETLGTDIATARSDLINAQSLLADDEAYLKDLTEQCETRAKDWDQRSKMRSDELATVEKAIALLKNDVQEADENVNLRAALIQKKDATVKIHSNVGFLQERSSSSSRLRGLAVQQRTRKAVELLRASGQRLGSLTLTSMALHAASDPFAKVNTLIQNLIERLLKEATEEANKKGFCDTEASKANKDRSFRWNEMQKLNVEIAALEAKKEDLTLEMQELGEHMENVQGDLTAATDLRQQEKAENLATLQEAKDGLAAVEKALVLLKGFYKEASKAEALIQASPVDEDTSGPGFSGAYKGKQAQSSGIIGLLEVIKSDFERTIANTKEAESTAASDYVKFERTSKADLAGKETKDKLDGEDLESTEAKIASKYKDLQTASDLHDSALKSLEELKPMCTDSSMTYAERVQKREDEIDALKQALCLLDPEGVEEECNDSAVGPS